jgi:ankyrin repeat protein
MRCVITILLLQDGATPLFKAAHKGHTAVIGELLKYRPSLGVLPVSEF